MSFTDIPDLEGFNYQFEYPDFDYTGYYGPCFYKECPLTIRVVTRFGNWIVVRHGDLPDDSVLPKGLHKLLPEYREYKMTGAGFVRLEYLEAVHPSAECHDKIRNTITDRLKHAGRESDAEFVAEHGEAGGEFFVDRGGLSIILWASATKEPFEATLSPEYLGNCLSRPPPISH